MKIKALFKGIMQDWVGAAEAEFDLKKGATYSDLLREIHRRFGRNFAQGLWDPRRKAFAESVAALLQDNARKLDDLKTELKDGQCINFFLLALGG